MLSQDIADNRYYYSKKLRSALGGKFNLRDVNYNQLDKSQIDSLSQGTGRGFMWPL